MRSFPAGSRLVRVGGEPLEHLYVIREGSVRLERDGQVLQVLEEGESFGYTSLISEAYRFLLGLRLRLQLRLLSEGRPTTNKVALSELSVIERGRLKDSLHAINRWQEAAAYHFQTGF